ncbi:phage tail assembly chaperone [Hansschlegelia sp. KR7-227]|uniref:phage tail assembly chaperone n=1 Tax=Hansschlegelia sp. KR7-227 TaxID=3400914 RepID=UPI003C00B575
MLNLPPEAFWRTTPREIAAAARGRSRRGPSVAPLRRAELDGLMARFPDVETPHGA